MGFQPLEAISSSASWPAPTETDPHPEGLGAIVAVPERGHYASHARGYVHAPLAKVYAALHEGTRADWACGAPPWARAS